MKLQPSVIFVIVTATLALAVVSHAEFAPHQSADLVLGQAAFDTSGTSSLNVGLNTARDVAIDPITGKVFVADGGNNRVLRYATSASLTSGAAAEVVLGQGTFNLSGAATAQNRMSSPSGICVDLGGRLWVADFTNNRVLKFEGAATKMSGAPADCVFGQAGSFNTNGSAAGDGGMNGPSGVFVDSSDRLWVADQNNHRVLRFSGASLKLLNNTSADAGTALGQPDSNGTMPDTQQNRMRNPIKLIMSAAGDLWVSDSGNNRILRFGDAAGKGGGANADQLFGQPDFMTNNPGNISASQFNSPVGLAIDAAGTLYVGDRLNHRVVFFKDPVNKNPVMPSADGVLGQTDLSKNVFQISGNGMRNPFGIALDSVGRLYVAQAINAHRVTRYSPLLPINGTPTIIVMGKRNPVTSKITYTLKGAASSPVGIMKVQYRLGSKGAFKFAGNTFWRAKVRKLKVGINKVMILATANDNKIASKIVKIRHRL